MMKRLMGLLFVLVVSVYSSLPAHSSAGAAAAPAVEGEVAAGAGHAAPLAAVAAPVSIDIVNPCSDFGFKRAFKDPQVAMGFLNTILNLDGESAITELSYVDQELQSRSLYGRDFRVDVLCRTKKEEWFLLEMQNDYREDYPDKALVEFCRLMGNVDAIQYQDCTRSEDHAGAAAAAPPSRKRPRMDQDFWKSVKSLITLVISNKEFPADKTKERFPDQSLMEPGIVNTYTMRHTEQPERCLGSVDARIVLVMLANFKKGADALESNMDRWLFALKDEGLKTGRQAMETYKHIDSLTTVEGDSQPLKRFYQLLDKTGIEGDRLREYEESIRLVNSAMERQFGEGRAAGLAEGLRQAAQVMKGLGIPDQTIAEKLGLTPEDVSALPL